MILEKESYFHRDALAHEIEFLVLSDTGRFVGYLARPPMSRSPCSHRDMRKLASLKQCGSPHDFNWTFTSMH